VPSGTLAGDYGDKGDFGGQYRSVSTQRLLEAEQAAVVVLFQLPISKPYYRIAGNKAAHQLPPKHVL
jgi:hypothetical protein